MTIGSAIEYFVEGAVEGSPATVAEAAKKPQIHFANPTPVLDPLRKIAEFIKISDETLQDLPRLAARINGRLLYLLALTEEYQLLNGGGTGTDLVGLLKRSGIQTYESPEYDGNADAIFHARTLVSTQSGFSPDAVIINDLDYEAIRLSKDANRQYYGGGMFSGAAQPDIWGTRTIVTPAVAQGTVVVGAFNLAATAYRKGGISIAATNSNEDDFTKNLWLVRAEERIALAVERPAAFCKVTLAEPPEPDA
jgi:HK97 family phage major capsid protein